MIFIEVNESDGLHGRIANFRPSRVLSHYYERGIGRHVRLFCPRQKWGWGTTIDESDNNGDNVNDSNFSHSGIGVKYLLQY